MRAPAEGLRGSRRQPGSRPGWIIVAFCALAVSVAYLCVSVTEAIHRSSPADLAVAELDPAAASVAPAPTVLTNESGTPAAPPPRAAGAPAVGDPKLLAAIEDAIADDRDHLAVSVRNIADGRMAAVNGDYQFYAASTFKLAVLYEAAVRLSRGELSLDDHFFIPDEAASEDLGTSGSLEFEEDGSITVRHLLEAMITVSDNSSAVTLASEFGSNAIDATMRDVGVTTMTVSTSELWTTADDLARLMEVIYLGEGVGDAERDLMRDLLLAQTIRSGIPDALRDEIEGGLLVGNKTGTWPGAQHDVAFIEGQEGAYVLAILTDGSYEGWLALHRIAARVHMEMTN